MAAPERFPTKMPSPFASNDERWAAVVNRDRSARAEFVYSVATTGVYCRPGCPARRPRREHVRFHASCEDAERAGSRPCRRCRPNEPSLAERHAEAVAVACRLIHTVEELPDLDALAGAVGMSRFHFHRIFKVAAGCTPRAYVAAHRAARMRNALRTSQTVTDAIYDAGFNSNGRFYAASSEILGMAPATFMRGGPRRRLRRSARVRSRAAARHPRDDVPAAGVARAPRGSRRRDGDLPRDCRSRRLPQGGPGSRARLCFQPARRCNPLPPGGPDRRRARRLSLGRGTQAGPACP